MKPLEVTVTKEDGTTETRVEQLFDFRSEEQEQLKTIAKTLRVPTHEFIEELEYACLGYKATEMILKSFKPREIRKALKLVRREADWLSRQTKVWTDRDASPASWLCMGISRSGVEDLSAYFDSLHENLRLYVQGADWAIDALSSPAGKKRDYPARVLVGRVIRVFLKLGLRTPTTKESPLEEVASICLEAVGHPSGTVNDYILDIMPVLKQHADTPDWRLDTVVIGSSAKRTKATKKAKKTVKSKKNSR